MAKYCGWTESLVKFCFHILEFDRLQCYSVEGKSNYWLSIVSGVERYRKCSRLDCSIKHAAKVAVEFDSLVAPLKYEYFFLEQIGKISIPHTSFNIASRSVRRLFVNAISQVCNITELLNFSIKNFASSTV